MSRLLRIEYPGAHYHVNEPRAGTSGYILHGWRSGRGPILGSQEFVQRVKEKVGGRGQVEEEKSESRRVSGVTMEEIIASTAEVYGVTVERIVRSRRGEENEARAMVVYLGRQLGGHKLREIGRAVGGLEKYSSVSTAHLKMKRRVQQEPELAGRTRRVETQLLRSQRQT